MDIKSSLGLKIKILRKKHNITQEKFAELIDMNPRQIVRIENGESFPTSENLDKIAKIFDVQPQELFYSDYLESEQFLKDKIINKINNLSLKDLRTIYLVTQNM